MTKKTIKKPKVKVLKRIGRPMTLPGVWGDMARAAGSVEGLGQQIGKSVRQVRRIANGESPMTGSTRIAAMAFAAKHDKVKALEEWELARRK